MTEKLYNVLHFETTGWEVVDKKLTKEQASLRLQAYMNDGISPNDLRVDVYEEHG